ncbi:SDR family NAD(P)-dependent oxidoreductase [Runella slithyformis]|uniref:Short-chain dehydrogenase/reductase SDR n=1 Tax=Runella slithyformis (strain ATCC 29530 / DSM 19594 / LMG 11500 / NCIMB 11436 / LSU 4) TaxID=761193 RepID=A0A7U3ZGJ4_RUNSL|nr:SDR family NAD(P)-dependent oxidoreductase [Runella slithyformis]AEI46750.1 short-chain dehydrogenase/reductase SDR [Runella slithyformis DSM 19594]
MSSTQPYALVTGASRGIGKAIAKELAARQYNLLLVSVDEPTLRAAAFGLKQEFPTLDIRYFAQDLSAHGAVGAIKEWSAPFRSSLNVVVNNAGFGLTGRFEELSVEEQLNMIDVNFKALVALSHAFIPILTQSSAKKAYLLNVASTTAYQSVPYLSVYTATKAAVLSFSRSIRHELSGSKVSVSVVSPGSTDTNFVQRARMGEEVKKLAEKVNMTPEEVAKIAVAGLFQGKAEIVPGFLNVLNAFLPRLVPKILVEKIAGNIYKPKG